MKTKNSLNKMEINSENRCSHCGHWSVDAEVPFVIYSAERAKWLEEAAKEYIEMQGDDSWLDWMKEGKRLTKLGQ
jgi:hypothetical protein